MQYLRAEEILVIHDRVLMETGGAAGVRDSHLLASAAERPKTQCEGVEQYRDVHTKAASLLEALVQYHVFVDGNKRTALTSAALFLRLNGERMQTLSVDEGVTFMQKVAVENVSVNTIALWLEKHCR